MATKNAAVARPTGTRCLGSATRLAPIANSATPDSRTTASSERGSDFGTCATNSSRAKVRWLMPVNSSIAPSATRATVRPVDNGGAGSSKASQDMRLQSLYGVQADYYEP